jgi:hypothetical protein
MVTTKAPRMYHACGWSGPVHLRQREDAKQYLVKVWSNLKGFEVVTETESDFAKRHLKDVIIDIYAADIITDELDVRDAADSTEGMVQERESSLNDSFKNTCIHMRYGTSNSTRQRSGFEAFLRRVRIDDPLGIAVCILRERLYGHVYWRNYNSWWLSRRYRIGRYRRLVS